MQAQAYEGYFENGQFYPAEQTVRTPMRLRAVLTVLDPIDDSVINERKESARKWLDELNGVLRTATTELNEENFPRMRFGRELITF